MDLRAEIKWIQEELDRVEDPVLLETFKRILLLRKKSDSDEIEDIELYNKEIEAALSDIEHGRVHSHEEVGHMIEKWIGK